MSYESGQVTASIVGTISASAAYPKLAAVQAVTSIAGTGNAGLQSIYTVAAGKVAYLYGCTVGANAAVGMYIFKTDGTTRVSYCGCTATTAFGATMSSIPMHAYAAGEIVKVNCSNSGEYNVYLLVQDA